LEDWYEKALNFKRSKEAIKEFGERKSLENLGEVRKKLVLDVLRRDPVRATGVEDSRRFLS